MNNIYRRKFLGGAAISGLTGWSLPAVSYARIVGANDRVRLALIGCGGRGQSVARLMNDKPNNAEYVAFADVYTTNALRAKRSLSGNRGDTFQDFRHLLDREDIHAVHVATPDHWHAIPVFLACLAGKDSYVEKPLTHNIAEGKALVDAANASNCIVQTGTQHRSAPHYKELQQMIEAGEIGDVRFARIWNYTNRTRPVFNFGTQRSSALDSKPQDLDWDFYCGPAPLVGYERTRFLGSFRYYYEYAGGYVADYGAHRFDSMRQLLGEPAPTSVTASGGRYLDRPGNTPDVVQATVQFPTFTMSYEAVQVSGHGVGGRTEKAKYYRMNGDDDRPHGIAIYGSKAVIIVDRIGYDIYPETNTAAPRGRGLEAVREAYKSAGVGKYVDGNLTRRFEQSRDCTDLHCRDFLNCVRSRKQPSASVEIGHGSCVIPHLINIAYRTDEKIHWDAASQSIKGSPRAVELVTRRARSPWNLVPGT